MKQLILKSLNLQNFATFKNQSINFDQCFNAVIGETGSGKSLILDAIQIILGFRADKKFVRKDSEFASIEAIFESHDSDIKLFFDENGFPYDGPEIVFKRIIYKNDSSKSFINFQSCNASLLNAFSKRFIDIVGQFENQKLLSESYQLILLDQYCQNNEPLKNYRETYSARQELITQLKLLNEKINNQESILDYLKFQIEEIEKISPTLERETELLDLKSKFLNKDKRKKITEELHHVFSSDEKGQSILQKLDYCNGLVQKNGDLISDLQVESLDSAIILLKEFARDLNAESISSNEEINIDSVLSELDQYQKLKRKFGGSIESVNASLLKFIAERDSLLNQNKTNHDIELRIDHLTGVLYSLAKKLSENRKLAVTKLSQSLSNSIQQLNMKGAIAEISIQTETELGPTGLDKIQFMVQTNPGEGFHLIKEVASGGELSRILLALRKILSSTDSISIFLFDEIDTGIGGETAVSIGKMLADVSDKSQVIAITHLPQIATFAKKLISVSKDTIQNRTESHIDEAVGLEKRKFIEQLSGHIH